ncbi:protein ORF47 [Anguillid herpesvirus 1]|uniref:Protein ORF47 n=1 Tax=Anguillid herpesvirus 1 TaxID=150286 RepID=A0A8E5ETV5_9VIRU|nr:protein ORF47 [Anguillid herpesvirus 1]QRM16732.1 protein ORF47 [Anguillid herpesvirus 1]QRM16863.1 protein ORF47 [Anguillid herpesvirus 1]UWI83621.1 protein ORF47 [Anguillid herpesvirus 1]
MDHQVGLDMSEVSEVSESWSINPEVDVALEPEKVPEPDQDPVKLDEFKVTDPATTPTTPTPTTPTPDAEQSNWPEAPVEQLRAALQNKELVETVAEKVMGLFEDSGSILLLKDNALSYTVYDGQLYVVDFQPEDAAKEHRQMVHAVLAQYSAWRRMHMQHREKLVKAVAVCEKRLLLTDYFNKIDAKWYEDLFGVGLADLEFMKQWFYYPPHTPVDRVANSAARVKAGIALFDVIGAVLKLMFADLTTAAYVAYYSALPPNKEVTGSVHAILLGSALTRAAYSQATAASDEESAAAMSDEEKIGPYRKIPTARQLLSLFGSLKETFESTRLYLHNVARFANMGWLAEKPWSAVMFAELKQIMFQTGGDTGEVVDDYWVRVSECWRDNVNNHDINVHMWMSYEASLCAADPERFEFNAYMFWHMLACAFNIRLNPNTHHDPTLRVREKENGNEMGMRGVGVGPRFDYLKSWFMEMGPLYLGILEYQPQLKRDVCRLLDISEADHKELEYFGSLVPV